jgi:hypothetical protein
MKRHETWFGVCVAVSLITASCVDGSNRASLVAPAPVVATATPSTVEAPTSAAASAVADDRIEAAVNQLDAEVAAGKGPSETFAYDLIDSKVDAEGFVTLTICAWTGDTVFDTVRDSLYRTEVDTDGSITATHMTTPVATGDCVNTQLIESALALANKYDVYWNQTIADPNTFVAEDAQDLLTDDFLQVSRTSICSWVSQDVQFPSARPAGSLAESVAADILWRRFTSNGVSAVEFAICRDMDPERGAYRDGILIDDGREESADGPHSVDSFQLVPTDGEGAPRWLVSGRESLIWTDCFATGDWPRAASIWQQRATDFDVLDS